VKDDFKPSKRMDPITSFIVMDILEEAKTLERKGEDIVHLEVGEPDFPPPPPVIDAICRAARDGHTHYTHSLGVIELREAIAAWYLKHYSVDVDPEQVIVTPGTSIGFLHTMAVLLEQGDKIALTDPGYPCYQNYARLLGIEPVAIKVDPEKAFIPTMDQVNEAVAAGAKAVLIASPANPTGCVLDSDTIRQLTELSVPLISDEIYHGLTYDDVVEETALQYSQDAIVINGLSKRMAMTGLRVGWVIVPKQLVRPFQKLNQNIIICPDSISQQAAITALSDPTCDEAAIKMRDVYSERRRILLDGLVKIGFKLHHEPKGAFYIFADCSNFTNDGYKFALRMLREAKVAATPGVDFGRHGTKNYVRFAYTIDVSRIEEGLSRIRKWVGN